MPGSRIAVVLIGEQSAPEMQPVVSLLQSCNDRIALNSVPNAVAFQQQARGKQTLPDMVVALQRWPGEYSAEEVLSLLSLVPLARIVCVSGRWCDSEGRTDKSWPIAVRSPVPSAPSRLARELAALERREPFIPLTASRAETFAIDCNSPPDSATCPRKIPLFSPDRHWKGMLAAAMCRSEHQLVTVAGTDDAAIVWDADPWDEARAQELRVLRRDHPQSRIVACSGFVDDDLIAGLKGAGADTVWFKLSPLATLMTTLDAET